MNKNCEKCGVLHDGTYGVGRFCSRQCSNSRKFSQETIEKKRIKALLYHKNNPKSKKEKTLKDYICIVCRNNFKGNIKKNRHIKCYDCRKIRVVKKDATSLFEFSTRTIAKIIKRAKLSCSMCQWNETALDVHHIVERKNGGSNDLSNLIAVCPNCHRKSHEKKYSKEQLFERSMQYTLPNWKDFYDLK
jgi:5-methylcytosine-specific restriction endonuclease McrA